jgi:LacI family transcriptional regulator
MSELQRPGGSTARQATLQDVARRAGVSIKTVSRVVNREAYVHANTKARVLAAIDQVQYRPNELARSLKTHRSSAIGFLVDISNPFYASCAVAAEEVLREHGFAVIFAASRTAGNDEQRAVELFRRYQAQGLLIVPTADSYDFLRDVWADRPIVALDQPFKGITADAVLVHNADAARLAVDHLLEHGHRSIAFIGADPDSYTTQRRLEGYEESMRIAGASPLIRVGADGVDSASRLVAELLRENPRPTALFAGNNLITVGVLRAVADAGLSVPEDLALIGFDDVTLGDVLHPQLTVVRQPSKEIGRRAGELLISRLRSESTSKPETILLDSDLVIRESCGCRRNYSA